MLNMDWICLFLLVLFSFLGFIVRMITEFLFALEGNNEATEVMTGNAGYVLLVRTQEIGKIAHAGGNPGDRLGALALSPAIGLIGYQCVLKCHHFKPLTLIV